MHCMTVNGVPTIFQLERETKKRDLQRLVIPERQYGNANASNNITIAALLHNARTGQSAHLGKRAEHLNAPKSNRAWFHSA